MSRHTIAVAAPPYAAEALEVRLAAEVPGARVVRADARTRRRARALFLYVESGHDPVDAIRATEAPPAMPVIALCERPVDAALVSAAIAAGAADCLPCAEQRPGSLALALARATALAARLEGQRRGLSSALERARSAAATDCVTGLYNRRYFDEHLEAEEKTAYRSGRPLSLVLADLDAFKSVNDLHGHGAGDRVLRSFARMVERAVRSRDIACRHGGDEFGILLPDTSAEDALVVVERIAAEVRAREIGEVAGGLRLTASFGLADLPSAVVATREQLVRAADQALYRAKELGRDRIVVAGSSEDGAPPAGEGARLLELERGPLHDSLERLRTSIRALSATRRDGFLSDLEAIVDSGAGEAAEPRVFGRARTVAEFGGRIAAALGLSAEKVGRIRRAGVLQDLGMVPLAPALAHGGDLEPGERELLKQHPALSMRLADDLRVLREELPIILHHHENFDGSGYPRGLRGERIPIGSRVLAVAGAYEAMTSARPYRAPLRPSEAAARIDALSGKWYDPAVVGAFRSAFNGTLAS